MFNDVFSDYAFWTNVSKCIEKENVFKIETPKIKSL
jgi:hypothetical protein